MDDIIIWVIIIGFYAPLHFIPPILLVMFKSDKPVRSIALRRSLIDCSLSMALAFVVIYFIGLDNMLLAMAILFGAMFLPYLRVIKISANNRESES